ncbi:MAG: Stp1/IreP family PP2C-type Ser/Thr phosphatase [Clostridiales bacterium]|nr:Stp1/IreP family PP2C-type Ser/Thr phosphatase [Clostridiales bacterium]MCD8311092.1 Stp1/IreP family PP2C-type Ser/Thr phosphatase [Bacillota bacterium]
MKFAAKTDMGLVRSSNQDEFATMEFTPDTAFFLVCDGMGGANGGEEASRIACDSASRSIKEDIPLVLDDPTLDRMKYMPKILSYAVQSANLAVYDRAFEDRTLKGMGTTLVGAVVLGDTMYVVNVGDSRLYLITEAEVIQVTRDHSYVQYLVDMGVITENQAENSPRKNIITRAIGTDDTVDPDTFNVTLSDGQYVLLCSDGLSKELDKSEIFRIVHGEGTIEEKTDALIERAKELGGHDNITVVLVQPIAPVKDEE